MAARSCDAELRASRFVDGCELFCYLSANPALRIRPNVLLIDTFGFMKSRNQRRDLDRLKAILVVAGDEDPIGTKQVSKGQVIMGKNHINARFRIRTSSIRRRFPNWSSTVVVV